MPEVFKCSVQEMRRNLIFRTENLNTSVITSYGTDSCRENNPQTREEIIRKEIRRIPQEVLNRVVGNFNVRVAAVLSYSTAVHGIDSRVVSTKIIL